MTIQLTGRLMKLRRVACCRDWSIRPGQSVKAHKDGELTDSTNALIMQCLNSSMPHFFVYFENLDLDDLFPLGEISGVVACHDVFGIPSPRPEKIMFRKSITSKYSLNAYYYFLKI